MIMRRRILAKEAPDQQTEQVDHAPSHMHAMETSQEKERGAKMAGTIEITGEEDASAMRRTAHQVGPFIGLEPEEDHATKHRQEQKEAQTRLIVMLNRRQRFDHRDAATNQDEGHEGC